MTPQQLERRFLQAATAQAARLGYGFGPDSFSLLEQLIRDGAARAVADGRDADEAFLSLADANAAAFAARMVIEAKALNLAELRETTFHAARNALCPIWPFC